MSNIPAELRYAQSHEWARLEADGSVTVGISDHAQEALGDVVFIELPELGKTLAAGQEAGVVESVKAASDIYSPIGGEVIAINEALADTPEDVNNDPYASWFFKLAEQSGRAGQAARCRWLPGRRRRGRLSRRVVATKPAILGQGLDHSRFCSLQRRNAFSPSLLSHSISVRRRSLAGRCRPQRDRSHVADAVLAQLQPADAFLRRHLGPDPAEQQAMLDFPRSFHSRRTDRADGAAGDPPQPAAGTACRARRTGRPGAPAATPGSTSAGPA